MRGWCEKKLTAFRTTDNVRCLDTGGSPKKFRRDAEYPARFVLEMKVALDFEYDTFSIDKEQQNMCPVKIGLIFYFVLYI